MSMSWKTIPTLEQLQSGYPGLKGLFFDMDGTLFDTENYHAQALLKLGSDHQIKAPLSVQSMYELMVGRADHLVFDVVKSWEGFPDNWTVKDFVEEKNRNLLEILSRTKMTHYFPEDTKRLIQKAKRDDFFVALVTSSEKVITSKLLEIAGLDQTFNLVLTRDDCPKHKPDPWPYLKAIEISNLSPNEIVIFEDSPVGLEAARLSGSHVIKVEWFPGMRL